MDLPKVTELVHSTENLLLNLEISNKLRAFEGHFDSEPIIPGVVQIQWALAFSDMYLKELGKIEVEHLEGIKFQNVIRPGVQLTLALSVANQKLRFAYTSPAGKHSSGRIVIK